MLKNAPTLAIVAVHTEENEPPRILISNITNIYIHYLEPSLGRSEVSLVTEQIRIASIPRVTADSSKASILRGFLDLPNAPGGGFGEMQD